MIASAGRYGGTFAHTDIAFEFGYRGIWESGHDEFDAMGRLIASRARSNKNSLLQIVRVGQTWSMLAGEEVEIEEGRRSLTPRNVCEIRESSLTVCSPRVNPYPAGTPRTISLRNLPLSSGFESGMLAL